MYIEKNNNMNRKIEKTRIIFIRRIDLRLKTKFNKRDTYQANPNYCGQKDSRHVQRCRT